MSKCIAYEPQQGYKYQILTKYQGERAFEHLDYAKDRTEKEYLLKEYRLAQGSDFTYTTILLPKKYWKEATEPDRQAKDTMQFELCKDTSQCLIDICNKSTWREAREEFKKRGYTGKYLLIHVNKSSFKVFNINIKEKEAISYEANRKV